jgi:hypothetical protein
MFLVTYKQNFYIILKRHRIKCLYELVSMYSLKKFHVEVMGCKHLLQHFDLEIASNIHGACSHVVTHWDVLRLLIFTCELLGYLTPVIIRKIYGFFLEFCWLK